MDDAQSINNEHYTEVSFSTEYLLSRRYGILDRCLDLVAEKTGNKRVILSGACVNGGHLVLFFSH